MLSWVVRGLLVLAGVIAGWFVAPDTHEYQIVSFVATMLLVTLFVAIAAFYPVIWRWIQKKLNVKKRKHH
ncbi:MAG: hypothetical protein ACTHJ4_02290 [Candidatus Nucleicultricaceae bacterium]